MSPTGEAEIQPTNHSRDAGLTGRMGVWCPRSPSWHFKGNNDDDPVLSVLFTKIVLHHLHPFSQSRVFTIWG